MDYDEQEAIAENGHRALEERKLLLQTLCGRCKHGTVYRRKKHLEVTAYCHKLCQYVPPDLVECTDYEPNTALNINDLTKIAVLIDTRKGIDGKAYL